MVVAADLSVRSPIVMSEKVLELTSDPVWEQVLHKLSSGMRLSHFYKVSRKELKSYVANYGHMACHDLAKVYRYASKGQFEVMEHFLEAVPDVRVYCMILSMLKSLRCWVETESPFIPELALQQKGWTIAHA